MFRYLIEKIFGKPKPEYTYGTIGSGSRARKHKSGKVETVLWKAGEQGHKEDYWHVVGDGWPETFKAE